MTFSISSNFELQLISRHTKISYRSSWCSDSLRNSAVVCRPSLECETERGYASTTRRAAHRGCFFISMPCNLSNGGMNILADTWSGTPHYRNMFSSSISLNCNYFVHTYGFTKVRIWQREVFHDRAQSERRIRNPAKQRRHIPAWQVLQPFWAGVQNERCRLFCGRHLVCCVKINRFITSTSHSKNEQ